MFYRNRALPGAQEEHAAAQDAVFAIEPVDDAPSFTGGAGMIAPGSRARYAKAAQLARKGMKRSAKTRAKRLQLRHLK